MQLEVLSTNANASSQILMALNRRFKSKEQFENQLDILCLEVAEELGYNFEINGENLSFKDKQ